MSDEVIGRILMVVYITILSVVIMSIIIINNRESSYAHCRYTLRGDWESGNIHVIDYTYKDNRLKYIDSIGREVVIYNPTNMKVKERE